MSYMLLIQEPVGQRATRTDEEGRAVYEHMLRFGEALREEGVLLGGQSLAPLSRATRVRVEAGKTRAVDGPFAEAKEMIGGFFHVDVATHDAGRGAGRALPRRRVGDRRGARTGALLRGVKEFLASRVDPDGLSFVV